MKKVLQIIKEQTIVCLLLVFVLVLAILRPSFVSANNIKNVLIDVSIYGVAAIAMTISIITGAFDLSLASNFAWAQTRRARVCFWQSAAPFFPAC